MEATSFLDVFIQKDTADSVLNAQINQIINLLIELRLVGKLLMRIETH